MKSTNPPTATTKTASPPPAIIKFRRKLPRRALRDTCWRRSRAPCLHSYLSFRSAITASRSAYPSQNQQPRIHLNRPYLYAKGKMLRSVHFIWPAALLAMNVNGSRLRSRNRQTPKGPKRSEPQIHPDVFRRHHLICAGGGYRSVGQTPVIKDPGSSLLVVTKHPYLRYLLLYVA